MGDDYDVTTRPDDDDDDNCGGDGAYDREGDGGGGGAACIDAEVWDVHSMAEGLLNEAMAAPTPTGFFSDGAAPPLPLVSDGLPGPLGGMLGDVPLPASEPQDPLTLAKTPGGTLVTTAGTPGGGIYIIGAGGLLLPVLLTGSARVVHLRCVVLLLMRAPCCQNLLCATKGALRAPCACSLCVLLCVLLVCAPVRAPCACYCALIVFPVDGNGLESLPLFPSPQYRRGAFLDLLDEKRLTLGSIRRFHA